MSIGRERRWDNDFDSSGAVLAVHKEISEVEKPLLNKEILQEQDTYGFFNYIRSMIECGATSVCSEKADPEFLMRNLNRPRQIVLPKSNILSFHKQREVYQFHFRLNA